MAEVVLTRRHEYISEVIALTKDMFFVSISKLYDDVRKTNKMPRYLLRDFQDRLERISFEIDYEPFHQLNSLKRLVYNVNIANLKLFYHENQDIENTYPDYQEYDIVPFIKNTFLAIAREIWKKPDLMYHRKEQQVVSRDLAIVEKYISSSIKQELRRLTPIIEVEEEPVDILTITKLPEQENVCNISAHQEPSSPVQSPRSAPNGSVHEGFKVEEQCAPFVEHVEYKRTPSFHSLTENNVSQHDFDESFSIDSGPPSEPYSPKKQWDTPSPVRRSHSKERAPSIRSSISSESSIDSKSTNERKKINMSKMKEYRKYLDKSQSYLLMNKKKTAGKFF